MYILTKSGKREHSCNHDRIRHVEPLHHQRCCHVLLSNQALVPQSQAPLIPSLFLSLSLSLSLSLLLFLRERQSVSGGEAEREGDTESEAGSRLQAVRTEPDVGLEPANREIMT